MKLQKSHCCWLLFAAIAVLPGCTGGRADDGVGLRAIPKPQVEPVVVRAGRIESKLELTGTLIPVRVATIVSEVDGVIESLGESSESIALRDPSGVMVEIPLSLDIGHKVKKGDVLVQIRPEEFQSALDVAQARLALAEKEKEKLFKGKRQKEKERIAALHDEAMVAYGLAKDDYDRLAGLMQRGVASQSQYEAAKAAKTRTEWMTKQTKAALEIAEEGATPEEKEVAQAVVKVAEKEVEVQKLRLKKTTIQAPFDAVVAARFVGVGDRVTAMPRVEIMQIMESRVLFAQVDVPEEFQRIVQLEDVAQVHADGVPEPLPGVVDLVSVKIDPLTRTFQARVTIDNRKELFRAGGFVRVKLPIVSTENALTAPVNAILFDEGQPTVFVVHGNRVKRTRVTLGVTDGTSYEVKTGLKTGDRIATHNTSMLADGMEVATDGTGAKTRAASEEASP